MLRAEYQKQKRDINPTNPYTAMKPLFRPRAVMTAQSTANGKKKKPTPSFADMVTAHELYRKQTTLHWTLHEKYNVPQCQDHFACDICMPYFTHVDDARRHKGLRPAEKKGDENEEHGDSDDEGSEDEDSEDGDSELGDTGMDCIFRLQDLRGKFRSMNWNDPVAQEHYEAGGFAAAKLSQAEAEAKTEAAQARQVSLEVTLRYLELQTKDAESKLAELRVEHGRVLTERDQAQIQLQEASTQLTAALKELEELRRDSDLPRKRARADPAYYSSIEAAGSRAAGGLALSPSAQGPSADPSWETLHAMTRPTALDAPIHIAHFIQFHEETDFKGIPTSGKPHWVVDMRDVRGYRQVMSRAPPKTRGQPVMERQRFGNCLTRLLQIIAVPGKYAQLLTETGTTVAEQESLTQCTFGHDPSCLSDAEVAVLLAQRGMTTAIADDAWQFCVRYILSQVANPDSFLSVRALQEILNASQSSSSPPGLYTFDQDQYPRTIPSMHKSKNLPGQSISRSR
ncbi:hypothetical protein B0H12DRAFT_296164 [Mycena haematopus]|nr:hypothetical protein B0H12DRAFT_296164 [Mycena haematopus]